MRNTSACTVIYSDVLPPHADVATKCRNSSRKTQSYLRVETLEGRLVPAVFNVNSLVDTLTPPAGAVTLRSALQAVNGTAGSNTINLTVPGIYKITTVGMSNETDNAAGELAYLGTGNLTIADTSGGAVTVDGGGLNRVFDINPLAQNTTSFTVTLQGLTILAAPLFRGMPPRDPAAASAPRGLPASY